MHKESTSKFIAPLPKISAAGFSMLLVVAIANLTQTSLSQWNTRPGITCDHGNSVHRYAEVNADRVNIRDLPTVFSNVLTQKNRPDKVVIVCEFGVWSRIDLSEISSETWISRGLISLASDQPITIRMKGVFLGLFLFGAAGLMLSKTLLADRVYLRDLRLLQHNDVPNSHDRMLCWASCSIVAKKFAPSLQSRRSETSKNLPQIFSGVRE